MSSFRRALGALVPSQGLLKALRVQGTTLLVWLLGLTCHPSWYDPQMHSAVRHVAKYWHSVHGMPWDSLALLLHIRLVGHMSRSDSLYIAASVGPVEILTEAARGGVRRARTGPDLTGSRRLQSYLRSCGDSMDAALNRNQWQTFEQGWMQSFGCGVTEPCVKKVPGNHFMWHPRCLQGIMRGSQSFYWSHQKLSELRRKEGWVIEEMEALADSQTYLQHTLRRCSSHTAHLRIYSTFDISVSPAFQNEVSSRLMVVEWSLHSSGSPECGLPFGCEAWRAVHL